MFELEVVLMGVFWGVLNGIFDLTLRLTRVTRHADVDANDRYYVDA